METNLTDYKHFLKKETAPAVPVIAIRPTQDMYQWLTGLTERHRVSLPRLVIAILKAEQIRHEKAKTE